MRARREREGSGAALTVFTIGHSTRPLAELIALLEEHGIRRLVDIRAIPRSRHNPQFEGGALAAALEGRGIEYRHEPGLGGLRHARVDSPNQGWRNASFRGFADYMQTPEFQAALERLLDLARERPTAILCAEAVPWRCHRSLVADALGVAGTRVRHIQGPGQVREHTRTPFARVSGSRITYPAAGPEPASAREPRGRPMR